MNERIRELALQAGIDDVLTPSMAIEKFALLIVRECAQLVQGVPVDTMGYHTADQKIKEHFGVE